MKRPSYSKRWVVGLFALVVALLAAQCGPVPTQEPAPEIAAPQEETPSTAAETGAEAESAEETTPQEEVVEENTSATTEAAPSVIDAENKLAEAVVGGSVFITDEPDVSAPRTKLGGEYRTVTSSDAVSFHPYLTNDTTSSDYLVIFQK